MKIEREVNVYDYVDDNGIPEKISAEFNAMFPSLGVQMQFFKEVDDIITSNKLDLFKNRRLEPGRTLLATFTHSIYC